MKAFRFVLRASLEGLKGFQQDYCVVWIGNKAVGLQEVMTGTSYTAPRAAWCEVGNLRGRGTCPLADGCGYTTVCACIRPTPSRGPISQDVNDTFTILDFKESGAVRERQIQTETSGRGCGHARARTRTQALTPKMPSPHHFSTRNPTSLRG